MNNNEGLQVFININIVRVLETEYEYKVEKALKKNHKDPSAKITIRNSLCHKLALDRALASNKFLKTSSNKTNKSSPQAQTTTTKKPFLADIAPMGVE